MPFMNINNTKLHYEIDGKGQPLVLITGFSADHSLWQPVVEEYAQYYQVITIDNRGCGQSDCPDQPYSVEQMADDVIALCDALKLDACHFIGSSMGGMILQSLAYRYPERVLSAVFENSMMQIDVRFALFAKGRLNLMQKGLPKKAEIAITLGWVFSSDFLNQANMLEALIETQKNYPYPMTEVGYRNQLSALLGFN